MRLALTQLFDTTPNAATRGKPSLGPSAVAVLNDGSHNLLIGATGSAGLWRYVEP